MDITELLTFGVANKASDMHLSSGLPPMLRINGEIRKVNLPPLEANAQSFRTKYGSRFCL